ncbi:AraC family transcriptional regulator [Enterococcus sp. JM4C]|uniref:AraC family transcriptional regulator n=1 Tax=Candidatus Enterococcus huntleyi TaxID=1857217 RepID=UPI00137B240C|nr:AraC family transcriptional regulator [Enterococcus sp. JM4C]KAF1299644.1 AraC family transcriptional regulator [Enterococcus sp. JM4C]
MNNNLREYTDKFTDFSKKSISDFILYNCGIETCAPSHSYGPKRRDYHFIHFVKEGKGVLEIEDQKIAVHENQFFIVPANVISTYTADDLEPWKYSWIGFTGIESFNFVQALIHSAATNFVIDCSDATFYEKRIEEIMQLNQNSLSSYYRINGIMYDIVGTLLSECEVDLVNNRNSSPSFQAMQYMDLHYHDDIQISDIAYSVGIHPNYLSAMFKEELGITPKKYLTNLKINKAKKLLIESQDPINLVASSVGFSDALSFSKFFKKELGISPTDFRKDIH